MKASFAVFLFILALSFVFPLREASANGRVLLTISVDWEGDDLQEENLAAMRKFREDFPEIHLVHFLNAAYFTQPGADPAMFRAKIASVLRPGDELGLHIHGWQGLFEAAGVVFQDHPTFWGTEKSVPQSGGLGHDVPIDIYSAEEMRKVIHFSVSTLAASGFNDLRSFRAGGWLAGPAVRQALVGEGFLNDSSAVPVQLLQERIGESPLYRWVGNLWPDTTVESQPYELAADGGGSLREFPDTLCLADYVKGEQVLGEFKALAAMSSEQAPLRLHFGFHQETAATYLANVRDALLGIRAYAAENGILWESVLLREQANY
jgi:hypothetical protein